MSIPAVTRVPLLPRIALAVLTLLPLPGMAAAVLIVDRLHGEVSAGLLGETRRLAPGDAVLEREVIRTGPDSALRLVIADAGLLEVGPDTRLAIEKLPVSPDAADLRSLLSLNGGYLRVQWTPGEPRAGSWPLHLFFGGRRSGLQPGEYFFERRAGLVRSCVASGRLAISAIAGDDVDQVRPGSCHDLDAAGAGRQVVQGAAAWESMRLAFSTMPNARPLLAMIPPPPEPPAVERADEPDTAVAGALPAPKPVPPAKLAAAPGGQPAGWTLLLGSYADPDNAGQVVAKLRGAGYTPFTRVKEVDGRTWHSVQLRGLPSREVAEAKAEEMRTALRINPVKVVLLP